MNSKTKNYIRKGIAFIGAIGVNKMLRSLVPIGTTIFGKVCCEVALDLIGIGTYELMCDQVIKAEKEMKQLLDNGGLVVV